MKIVSRNKGFWKYLTILYWKLLLYKLWHGYDYEIVETFEIEVSDEEAKKLGLK